MQSRLLRKLPQGPPMVKRDMTLQQALNQALHQMMAENDSVVCIGEDIAVSGGVFGVTGGLAERFGNARVIDTPISETAFVGMAVGAAMTGLKPMVELMFCDFAGVCFDQILNQAAKARFLSNNRLELPLIIRTTMGAGDGSGAMHSQSLHGLFACIPGLTVVCPSTPADAAGLLKASFASADPVVFMENKQLYTTTGPVGEDLPVVPLGKAALVRAGGDVTVVAASAMVQQALKAASALESGGVSVAVIDPRTIKPLDIDTIITSVEKTGRLLVVDEGAAYGGFADAVIAQVTQGAFEFLRSKPGKLTPPDTPVPYAVLAEQAWLPGAKDIEKAVLNMMDQNNDNT